MRVGMGFSMQCPAHPDDEKDRAEFWFVQPRDGEQAITYGGEHKPSRLFDHEGRDFEGLTVWQALPYPEESISSAHWAGYIARGQVYSCARWALL